MGSDHQVMPAISCVNAFSTANACFTHSRTFPKNASQTINIPWQWKGLLQKTGSPGNFRGLHARDEFHAIIPGTQYKIICLPCFPWTFRSGLFLPKRFSQQNLKLINEQITPERSVYSFMLTEFLIFIITRMVLKFEVFGLVFCADFRRTSGTQTRASLSPRTGHM